MSGGRIGPRLDADGGWGSDTIPCPRLSLSATALCAPRAPGPSPVCLTWRLQPDLDKPLLLSGPQVSSPGIQVVWSPADWGHEPRSALALFGPRGVRFFFLFLSLSLSNIKKRKPSPKKSGFPASLDNWAGPATGLPPAGSASLGGPGPRPPAQRLTRGPFCPDSLLGGKGFKTCFETKLSDCTPHPPIFQAICLVLKFLQQPQAQRLLPAKEREERGRARD